MNLNGNSKDMVNALVIISIVVTFVVDLWKPQVFQDELDLWSELIFPIEASFVDFNSLLIDSEYTYPLEFKN